MEVMQEKRTPPPSAVASHYTSEEPFSFCRHPINHRVIFHHQLLVASTLVSLVRWSERRWRSRWHSPGVSALEEPGSEPFTGSGRCRSSAHDLTGIQTGERRPPVVYLYFIFYGIQKYVQLVFTSGSSNNLCSMKKNKNKNKC